MGYFNAISVKNKENQKINPVSDEDIYMVLRQIRDAIALDPTINEAYPAKQVYISAGATLSTITTVGTVTTVTGMTNIGGNDASLVTENATISAWNYLRNLYS